MKELYSKHALKLKQLSTFLIISPSVRMKMESVQEILLDTPYSILKNNKETLVDFPRKRQASPWLRQAQLCLYATDFF